MIKSIEVIDNYLLILLDTLNSNKMNTTEDDVEMDEWLLSNIRIMVIESVD